MAEERATHAEQVTQSIWHDAARWRERALAAHPGDTEIRKGFHMGLAALIMEDLVEALGGAPSMEEIQERWNGLGMHAALFVITGVEEQAEARKADR